jgi:hypothetical protein
VKARGSGKVGTVDRRPLRLRRMRQNQATHDRQHHKQKLFHFIPIGGLTMKGFIHDFERITKFFSLLFVNIRARSSPGKLDNRMAGCGFVRQVTAPIHELIMGLYTVV